jgi:hypothetical protein
MNNAGQVAAGGCWPSGAKMLATWLAIGAFGALVALSVVPREPADRLRDRVGAALMVWAVWALISIPLFAALALWEATR